MVINHKYIMEKIQFTWNQILIIYLILGTALCTFLPLPELVKGAIATPAFLIIPYLFGYIMLIALRKQINITLSRISQVIVSFAVGFVFIPSIAFILHAFHLFNSTSYSLSLLLVFFLYFFKSKEYDQIANFDEIKPNKEQFMFLLTLLFAVLIIFSYEPFPFTHNHDSLADYITTSVLIKEYNHFSFSGSYDPSLTLIVSISSTLFQADVFTLFWYGNIFLMPFMALTTLYLLSTVLFKDKRIYFISFLSLLLAGFHTPLVSGVYYLFRQSSFILASFLAFLYVIEREIVFEYKKIRTKELLFIVISLFICSVLLFFYTFSWVHKTIVPITGYQSMGAYSSLLFLALFFSPILLKRRNNIVNKNFGMVFLVIVMMLLLFIIHRPMAMLMFTLICIFLILRKLSENNFGMVRNIGVLLAIVFMVLVLLQDYNVYDFTVVYNRQSQTDLANAGSLSRIYEFPVKRDILLQEYWTFPLFVIFLIGLVFGMFDVRYKKILPPMGILILCTISFYLFVKTLGSERSLQFANPLISLIIGYGIIMISSFANLVRIRVFRWAIITVCMVIFISLISYPMYVYMGQYIKGRIVPSHVTVDEYNAGKWMQNNLEKSTFVISDPLTNHAIGSTSGLRFPAMYHSKWRKMYFWGVMSSNDSSELYEGVKEASTWTNLTEYKSSIIPQYPIASSVIVINERTVKWMNTEEYSTGDTIPIPALTEYEITEDDISVFLDSRYFTLLYNVENILYVFGVNPQPGETY